ncbi:MAG: hypothetical protein KBT11_00835 [Treponema sp.]|nr:hypothetical protein [Candidatus Treponema equifaecale]
MFKKITAGLLVGLSLFAVSAAPKVKLSENGGKAKAYKSIQAALDAIGTKAGEFTIELPKGTYEEVLYYNGPATITLSGKGKAAFGKDVVIAAANDGNILACKKASSAQKNRCLFEFEGSGNLILENLTMHNTFERGSIKGNDTQAETLGYDGTGYVAAYNCSFLSHQDTLRTTGKTWMYKCYIEGDTDFIWMEESGIVALYEECDIVSVFDKNASNHTSYIGAPRMTRGTRAGKGLVVYNSKVSTQDGQNTFFARTPWNAGYWNQVAFINVDVKPEDIDGDIWYGKCLTAEGVPQTVIGWKMDAATAKNLKEKPESRKDVVSDADAKNEFGGRRAILNRVYDAVSNKYRKDSDFFWDVDALVAAKKWKVSEDKSNALLAGEKESVRTVYVLDGAKEYPELKCEGFAVESGKPHFQGAAGATIKFPVSGKALVTVTGYYAGNGAIQAGKQGAALYNLNNGSTSKFNEKVYVVYEDNAEVTITASAKSYITKITVDSDDSLSFVPVSSIEVTAEENATEVFGRRSLQMKAKLNPGKPTNDEYIWSVSDEKAASIDDLGVLKANAVAADTVITVRATSRDAKAVYGEKKIKILKPEAGAFAVTWLDSPESAASLAPTSDNDEVIKALNAVPAKGTWKFNSSKIAPEIAKGSLTYSDYSAPIDEKSVYIDFPITAKENFYINDVTVAFGNHGTGNIACLVTVDTGKKNDEIIDDTSRKCRSAKKTYEADPKFIIEKGQTVNVRVLLYGVDSSGTIKIPTNKAPTIATVTVTGKQVK